MSKFNKKKFFKELSSRYKNIDDEYLKKLKRYDKVVKRAEVVADLLTGNTNINKSKDELIRMLVDEYYSYQGSILQSFKNYKSKTVEQNFERAKELRVKDRFANFLSLFGEEKYTKDGKTKTLNEWMNEYLKGHISSKDLYFIFEWWQAINYEYMNEFYSSMTGADEIKMQAKSGNLF